MGPGWVNMGSSHMGGGHLYGTPKDIGFSESPEPSEIAEMPPSFLSKPYQYLVLKTCTIRGQGSYPGIGFLVCDQGD